jgi:hypothetical protein
VRVRPHKMSGRWLACFRAAQVWVAARSDAHCACSRARLDRMEIEAGAGAPASDADGRHARAGATLELQDTKTSPSAERGGTIIALQQASMRRIERSGVFNTESNDYVAFMKAWYQRVTLGKHVKPQDQTRELNKAWAGLSECQRFIAAHGARSEIVLEVKSKGRKHDKVLWSKAVVSSRSFMAPLPVDAVLLPGRIVMIKEPDTDHEYPFYLPVAMDNFRDSDVTVQVCVQVFDKDRIAEIRKEDRERSKSPIPQKWFSFEPGDPQWCSLHKWKQYVARPKRRVGDETAEIVVTSMQHWHTAARTCAPLRNAELWREDKNSRMYQVPVGLPQELRTSGRLSSSSDDEERPARSRLPRGTWVKLKSDITCDELGKIGQLSEKVVENTSHSLGLSTRTVKKMMTYYIDHGQVPSMDVQDGRGCHKSYRGVQQVMSEFHVHEIRMYVMRTNRSGGVVTSRTLRTWLADTHQVQMSHNALLGVKNLLKMRFCKVRGSESLKESERVTKMRFRFCNEMAIAMSRAEDDRDVFVFTDETYLNANAASAFSWGVEESAFLQSVMVEEETAWAEKRSSSITSLAGMVGDDNLVEAHRKASKGPRGVIVDAISAKGRVKGAFKSWRADVDNGDYHGFFFCVGVVLRCFFGHCFFCTHTLTHYSHTRTQGISMHLCTRITFTSTS